MPRRWLAGLAAVSSLLSIVPAPAGPHVPLPPDRAYRAYVRTIIVDTVGTVAGTAALRDCRSDRTQCQNALRRAQARVRTFQSDLDTNPPPPCLTQVDNRIRAGLEFSQTGLQIVEEGVRQEDSTRLIEGAVLALAGDARLAGAIRQALTTDC